MKDSRYPIGKYEPQPFSQQQKVEWFADIQYLPNELEASILNLDEFQLDTPYRDGGWTLRQVVHHVADSHINALIRFKLCLTEDNPTIKPYLENEWAKLDDVKTIPINISITILFGIHQRWLATIKNVKDEDWSRTVVHPEHNKQMTLWYLLGMYAWHGKHHTAHIKMLREERNWN